MDDNAKLLQFIQSTGSAYPYRRTNAASRPEQATYDINSGFDGADNPAGGLPGPMDAGGPYAVKGAAHADDRLKERTKFPPQTLHDLRKDLRRLELPAKAYYKPLRDDSGVVVAYAQIRRVPNRKHPVITTVLSNHMAPSGYNMDLLDKRAVLEPETNATPIASGKFDTDHIEPRMPESSAWNEQKSRPGGDITARRALDLGFKSVSQPPSSEVIESSWGAPKLAYYKYRP